MASIFPSQRPIGAVLEGVDAAGPLLFAAKSQDASRLQRLLSQQKYRESAMDDSLRICDEADVIDGRRYVNARAIPNLEFIIQTAAENAQPAPLAAAIAFAKSSQLRPAVYISRATVAAAITSGDPVLCEALQTGDPGFVNLVNLDLGHSLYPLALARLQGKDFICDGLLRNGADPSRATPRMFQPR
ncbi:uncharacterized protein PFLUO_LOCUS3376 [Penicillium psychrofluorescens]|uniref:uncharacterized protein n=1 Tax=Penicillium psychrofluorescens TaxID=3158075 RepID=UPI003CCDB071